jgi:hypothetical protein
VTPPTSDDNLLIREDWNHTRSSRVYTLKVWRPRREPTFASTAFVVWREIVLLDDGPKPNVQLSPALALHDAIHFAAHQLLGNCVPAPFDGPVGSKDVPPALESSSLLDEPWEGAQRYRLRVWAPQLDPSFSREAPFAWFHAVGLEHPPRPHHQISGALAIQNGIQVAARDLLAAGAHPVAS